VLQELPQLCPGTPELASSSKCLLAKYEPTLRYDSEETYYADSAAEISDNWGDEESGLWGENKFADPYTNSLYDGDSELEGPNFGLLSQSQPGVEWLPYQLTLASLGTSYPNGETADTGDWLDENENYVEDAHRLEAAGYMNMAYGKAFTDAAGKRWLEYWYWYYYNAKAPGGFGKHQGDWESVVVGLDSNNKPDQVIFSQHDGAASCDIEEVERSEDGGPIVYVGLESHANYQKPGRFTAAGEPDHADGNGPAVQPGLIVIGSSLPSWILWPGHWGNTRAGLEPFEATSPVGPAFHKAWEASDTYAGEAGECRKTVEEEFEELVEEELEGGSASVQTTAAPSIRSLAFVGRRPQVSYRAPSGDGKGFWPRLRISVNELGDGGVPPVSKTISSVEAKGNVTLPFKVNPSHEVVVLGSLFYKDGRRVHLTPRKFP
jgi:hypothetical protein